MVDCLQLIMHWLHAKDEQHYPTDPFTILSPKNSPSTNFIHLRNIKPQIFGAIKLEKGPSGSRLSLPSFVFLLAAAFARNGIYRTKNRLTIPGHTIKELSIFWPRSYTKNTAFSLPNTQFVDLPPPKKGSFLSIYDTAFNIN